MTSPHTRGFTLLELILVLLVMAVVSAFVLPNLFRPASAQLDDSARRMVRLLHLAAEEAQLRGTSLRFNLWSDHYAFELADDSGQWQPMSEVPFSGQLFPEGVSINGVKMTEGVQFYGDMQDTTPAKQDDAAQDGSGPSLAQGSEGGKAEKPPLGMIVLMSDGMLTLADVRLHAASGDVLLELRPGPGGIRVAEERP